MSTIESLNLRLSESVSKPRFVALLLSTFSALAGFLGMIGVYGVVSCRVRWQIRELAVRQALGAQASDILKLVLRDGFAIVAIGIALGAAGSLPAGRATRIDPLTLLRYE